MIFFLAVMIPFRVSYLGSFSPFWALMTAGKGEDDFLHPGLDLPMRDALVPRNLELGHDGGLGEAQKFGNHGRDLGVVRAHRLFAEEEQIEPGITFLRPRR